MVIITYRVPNFEMEFSNLIKTLGCTHIRTADGHLQANSLLERIYRQLKTTLQTRSQPALEGVITTSSFKPLWLFKEKMRITANELVPRIPGKLH